MLSYSMFCIVTFDSDHLQRQSLHHMKLEKTSFAVVPKMYRLFNELAFTHQK